MNSNLNYSKNHYLNQGAKIKLMPIKKKPRCGALKSVLCFNK